MPPTDPPIPPSSPPPPPPPQEVDITDMDCPALLIWLNQTLANPDVKSVEIFRRNGRTIARIHRV